MADKTPLSPLEQDLQRRQHGEIMQSIGQLTGAVQSLSENMTTRINDIRDEIRRLERTQTIELNRVESALGTRIDMLDSSLGKRIDSLGSRVGKLEDDNKKLIEKTARLSIFSGATSAGLVTAIVEVLKRIH